MYKIKNGILYKDNNPTMAIGVSYYSSFHPLKVPVKDKSKWIKEMKKDIQEMKNAGFNIFRTASIGNLKRNENGNVESDISFIEDMLKEADNVDIASAVRLHGYVTNLSNNKDFYMVDHLGNNTEKCLWNNFIVSSFYHKGINKDISDVTKHLSKKTAEYKNMVAVQIYNEPHYPFGGFYDYSTYTIKAYNDWLEKNGLKNSDKTITPPHRRPYYNENFTPWINWRKFARAALSKFLNNLSDVCQFESPKISTFTSAASGEMSFLNAETGDSYYDFISKMDFLGITTYALCEGENYFTAALKQSFAVDCANSFGKESWIVEYNANTKLKIKTFLKESYMASCSGMKGIIYYQWRGDYDEPGKKLPEPNGYGIINYDGTKTCNYDKKIKMIDLLNNLSNDLALSKKYRSGAVILYSFNAYLTCDAMENGNKCENRAWDTYSNRHILGIFSTYRELVKLGISPTVIDSKGFNFYKNKTKILYISQTDVFDEKEQSMLNDFEKNGGVIFKYTTTDKTTTSISGYIPYKENMKKANTLLSISDTINLANIKPLVKISNPFIMSQVVYGKDYYIISLVNISQSENDIKNFEVEFSFAPKKIEFISIDKRYEIVPNKKIVIDSLYDGAFLKTNY